MLTSDTKRIFRITATSLMSLALTVGVVGVAAADGSHGRGPSGHESSEGGRHFSAAGLVTVVGAGGFSLRSPSGTVTTYTTTSTTTYFQGTTAASASALVVGENARVKLVAGSTTVAASVSVSLVSFEGKVTAVAGNVITITGPGSTSRTVNVSSSTTYSTRSGAPVPTLASIVVGSQLEATGLIDPTSGAMTAAAVFVSTGHGHGHDGHERGHSKR